MTRAGLLSGAALAAAGRLAALALGLLLATTLFLFILIGDCWSVNDTPDAIRQCEIDKRKEGIVFLVLASGLWLAGVVRTVRGATFARRLALFCGPVAFVASLLI